MTITADDLIIAQRIDPDRQVPKDAPAPYKPGDLVDVLFHPLDSTDGIWMVAVVIDIERPDFARRFKVTVVIGEGTYGFFKNDRVYCWEDGTGEEVRPHRSN